MVQRVISASCLLAAISIPVAAHYLLFAFKPPHFPKSSMLLACSCKSEDLFVIAQRASAYAKELQPGVILLQGLELVSSFS